MFDASVRLQTVPIVSFKVVCVSLMERSAKFATILAAPKTSRRLVCAALMGLPEDAVTAKDATRWQSRVVAA